MKIKRHIKKFLKAYVNLVRRLRNPQKYKSIDFLYSYLNDKSVRLNEKADEKKNTVISFVCCKESFYISKSNAAYVKNREEADIMMKRGAAILITDTDFEDYPCMIADDPMSVYAKLCRYYRDLLPNLKVVAVTGSIGKTTTKDMIDKVNKMAFKTCKSLASHNVTAAAGFMVQHVPSDTEVLVQEVAESEVGKTGFISYMLIPDLVVLTPIDLSHYELFGSLDKIYENTCAITQYMSPKGKVIVNIDEFNRFDLLNGREVVSVSTKSSQADFYAENIKVDEQGLCFDVVIAKTNERCTVRLYDVYAPHNAIAAISAFAAGVQEGIPTQKIVEGLGNYRTSGVRQNVFHTQEGVLVYADCFNAVARSVMAAVNACDTIPVKGRRIAVIGDIEEAGAMSESAHKTALKYVIDSKFDILYTVGKKMKKALSEIDAGQHLHIESFDSVASLLAQKKSLANSQDLVLLKGSHSVGLEKCISKYWPKEYEEKCFSLEKESSQKMRKLMYH